MIIAANIGNTNFKLAVKKDNDILCVKSEATEIANDRGFIKSMKQMLSDLNLNKTDIKEVILSSVIPDFTEKFVVAVRELFGIDTFIVRPNVNMDLDLRIYNKGQIGTDRIVICEAAISKYMLPLVVFDFGTATTINVVDESKLFLGGAILTGITMGLDALSKNTAQLPEIQPNSDTINIIGTNTYECLLSGAIYGNISMIEGMVSRIQLSLNKKVNVIMTGGGAQYLRPLINKKIAYDQNLLFEGLYILLEKNIRKREFDEKNNFIEP